MWRGSRLKLPGPKTLGQISAGSREAQPGNVAGNRQRHADRMRAEVGLASEGAETGTGCSG